MKKFHKVYINEALGYREDKNKPLEEIQPIHPPLLTTIDESLILFNEMMRTMYAKPNNF